ncbi:Phospholipase A(1) [Bertholletia excelsa]
MRIASKPVRPCTAIPIRRQPTFRCCAATQPVQLGFETAQTTDNWETLRLSPVRIEPAEPARLNKRWMEYQGIKNWEGLLDPLDENLRAEIIRYGSFVTAAYEACDFDPSSPDYATCRFPKSSLLDRTGLPATGYRVTKNLRATSGINLPKWARNGPTWLASRSSWIGFVAVCQDRSEIARLGRRDVVVALRGTATCLEWLENLRATLTRIPKSGEDSEQDGSGPMVESGFLSLYTSGSDNNPSLQDLIIEEIKRILQSYGDEPLSFTFTGHSLGAALATLAAYDVKTTFNRAPLVTVVSFGGPRVGDRSFRRRLERQGTKVLRIVNSDDLITKVPGFVIDDARVPAASLRAWIRRRVEDAQWAYADVGRELRLSSRDSPYLSGSGAVNVATCHDLKTYLHLVNGFVSSACPFRATARRMMKQRESKESRERDSILV